jgi:hypothetical protein
MVFPNVGEMSMRCITGGVVVLPVVVELDSERRVSELLWLWEEGAAQVCRTGNCPHRFEQSPARWEQCEK